MSDPLQDIGQVAEGAGKVADIASKLIDFFTKITGVDVSHKIRMAEAQAKSIEIINHAEQKAELQGVILRILTRELYRQRNLTAIVQYALPLLASDIDPTKISEGFIHRFANAAEDVNENELQRMFAQVLAEEAASPDSISNRTLEILHTLSAKDALLIKKLASLVFKIGHVSAVIVPNKMRNQPWFYQLTYEQLMHLDEIGILNHKDLIVGVHPKSNYGFQYFEDQLIKYNPNDSQINVSAHVLTWDGAKIVNVADGDRDENYYQDVLKYLDELGLQKVEAEGETSQPIKLQDGPARLG